MYLSDYVCSGSGCRENRLWLVLALCRCSFFLPCLACLLAVLCCFVAAPVVHHLLSDAIVHAWLTALIRGVTSVGPSLSLSPPFVFIWVWLCGGFSCCCCRCVSAAVADVAVVVVSVCCVAAVVVVVDVVAAAGVLFGLGVLLRDVFWQSICGARTAHDCQQPH